MNVRQKVKELVEFIQDDDRLREERKKAKKNRDKYIGVSSDSMGYRGYCKSSVEQLISNIIIIMTVNKNLWVLIKYMFVCFFFLPPSISFYSLILLSSWGQVRLQ